MSNIKPIIEESAILNLLAKTFDQPIQDLAPIQSGHISQVFSFKCNHRDYILHFSKELMGSFGKDKFMFDTFAAPNIPIPPVLELGEVDGLYYAISQKMPGRELDKLSRDEYFNTLPSNMATLLAIHQTDVSKYSGYSWLDETGNGMMASWEETLTSVMLENPDDFHGRWHTLFETVLDRPYFEAAFQKMQSLIPFSPNKRYLIHRDYEYNNVLAENGKVTAVLDWGMASYGDFVYDIAYLDFWRGNVDLASHFREFYTQNGMDVSHFDERFTCCTLYIGLDGMRFCGKMGDSESIAHIQQILAPHLV